MSWLVKFMYNLETILDCDNALSLFKLLDIKIDMIWFNANILDDWWWAGSLLLLLVLETYNDNDC